MNNRTDCDNSIEDICCHELIRNADVVGLPNDDFNSVEFDRFKNSAIAEEID